jgi:hypothetical protein
LADIGVQAGVPVLANSGSVFPVDPLCVKINRQFKAADRVTTRNAIGSRLGGVKASMPAISCAGSRRSAAVVKAFQRPAAPADLPTATEVLRYMRRRAVLQGRQRGRSLRLGGQAG